MLRTLLILLTVLFAFVLPGCFSTAPSDEASNSGGSGSEIVGRAEDDDTTGQAKRFALGATDARLGLPVNLGAVFVYPRSMAPDTSWFANPVLPSVRTDSTGAFRAYDVPRGVVVVEVNDGSGNGKAKTVNVSQDSTTYDVGLFVVEQTGAIRIRAQTSLPGSIRFYVGVKGTRLVVRGTQTGVDVELGDIPTGITHTVSIRVYEPIELSYDIQNVNVSSGVTTVLQAIDIQ